MISRLVLLPLFLVGCTPSVLPVTECETNLECRDAMGFGSACEVETGLCRTVDVHPRCDATYPMNTTFPLDRDEQHRAIRELDLVLDLRFPRRRRRRVLGGGGSALLVGSGRRGLAGSLRLTRVP